MLWLISAYRIYSEARTYPDTLNPGLWQGGGGIEQGTHARISGVVHLGSMSSSSAEQAIGQWSHSPTGRSYSSSEGDMPRRIRPIQIVESNLGALFKTL